MDTEKFLASKMREVERFCTRRKVSLSRFGELVCGTTELVNRLRGKGNITIKTLLRIDQYIRENRK